MNQSGKRVFHEPLQHDVHQWLVSDALASVYFVLQQDCLKICQLPLRSRLLCPPSARVPYFLPGLEEPRKHNCGFRIHSHTAVWMETNGLGMKLCSQTSRSYRPALLLSAAS